MNRRYFEDLRESEPIHCQAVSFSRNSIITIAKEFDPQPLHIDEESASKSMFNGLIASSLHTLSACTKVVVEAQGNIAILSAIGLDEVKLFNPVHPGDILTVKAWWSDLRLSQSKKDRGIASIKCEVFNQEEQPVMKYGYRYLLACSNCRIKS